MPVLVYEVIEPKADCNVVNMCWSWYGFCIIMFASVSEKYVVFLRVMYVS